MWTIGMTPNRKVDSSFLNHKMFLILTFVITILSASPSSSISVLPTPTPWPQQFHSILFVNFTYSFRLQLFNLWYDYPNGRNLLTMRDQLSNEVRYDLEWNNGTSYLYTLDYNKKCRILHFPVGILRPDWLDGADFLGQEQFDGFLCNVWEKVDFVWYYEDVVTHMPVYWRFYNGMIFHVMTFEVGAVLEDSKWQAPAYCFGNNTEEESSQTLSIKMRTLRTSRPVSSA